jgi:hypothetical protein
MLRFVRSLLFFSCWLAMGCGPGTQSFPLDVAPADAKAAFGTLQACAKHLGHKATVSADSVRVEPAPERRIEFVLEADKSFTMMTWVANDGDRGQLIKLKVLGEALWDCASSRPAARGSATASTPASAPPPPPPPPPAPSAPVPTAVPTAEPTVAPTAAPTGAPDASPKPKSCEEDDTCAKPSGASCERNTDCNSGACARGVCM